MDIMLLATDLYNILFINICYNNKRYELLCIKIE
jgi:hypothetical protein